VYQPVPDPCNVSIGSASGSCRAPRRACASTASRLRLRRLPRPILRTRCARRCSDTARQC